MGTNGQSGRRSFSEGVGPIENDESPRLAGGSVVDYPTPEIEDAPLGQCIAGDSPAMQRVLQLADRVARTPSTSAFIVGESGVGKELIAARIHERSARRRGPYVCVNLAALPDTMVEAELFGSTRGAFTGAQRDRSGFFAAADLGTILLDELCEFRLEMQPKLLRVLENRRFFPVGSDRERTVNVRVIAATNRDPVQEVAAGRLRADLYHRLSAVIIRVPPLRERIEDIVPIARHFTSELAATFGIVTWLSSEAEQALCDHAWPGNVRELRNVIEHAVMMSHDGTEIGVDAIVLHSTSSVATNSPAEAVAPESLTNLRTVIDQAERAHIARAMQASNGSIAGAARMLGVSRSTLWEKLNRR